MQINNMIIGILAIQGSVIEHKKMLDHIGVKNIYVKSLNDIKKVDALIIPGGESTTITKILRMKKLDEYIKENDLPTFGTCAGAIIMAKEIIGMNQYCLGLIDMKIQRNAYGRQRESFETELEVKGLGKFWGIFIRAPIIRSIGKDVEVLSTFEGNPVLVRQRNHLAATFHPELTTDTRIHELFINMIK